MSLPGAEQQRGAAETHRAEITPVLGSHKGFFIPISVPEGIRVAGHQAGEIKEGSGRVIGFWGLAER